MHDIVYSSCYKMRRRIFQQANICRLFTKAKDNAKYHKVNIQSLFHESDSVLSHEDDGANNYVFDRVIQIVSNFIETGFQVYTTDWTRNYQGGGLVCLPKNTSEISKLLKYCNDNNIGITSFNG